MTPRDRSHGRAREHVSARVDSELGPAELAELERHLAGCPSCAAYAADVDHLRVLTRLLPREAPDPSLAAAIVARVGTDHPADGRSTTRLHRTTRSRWLRVAPLVFAAAVVGVVVSVVARPGTTPFAVLPASAEAAPLLRLTSVYLEREIVESADGDRARQRRISEKVWWQAPDRLRVERSVIDASGARSAELVIRNGADRYDAVGGRRTITRNSAPDLDVLPEPLSPTVALLGRPTGPGPAVAGRPTTTYELQVEGSRRIALVDNMRFVTLGGEDRFVLSKEHLVDGVPLATRTVTRLDLDVAIDAERFVLPDAVDVVDAGFRARPTQELGIVPPARPRGMSVVRAVSDRSNEAVLFQRGAFPILVSSLPPPADGAVEVEPTTVAGTAAIIRLPLYGYPSVTFTFERRSITVTAPLRPGQLVELVTQMYGPAE